MDTNFVQRPNRHAHSCAECIYLGSSKQGVGVIRIDIDWYYCPTNFGGPTIVGRFDSEGRAYWSSGGIREFKAENNIYPAGELTQFQEFFNMMLKVGT